MLSLLASGAIVTSQVVPLYGEPPSGTNPTPSQIHARFVGSVTCLSSMCHGGASPSRDQFTIWSQDDFHSRAYATLVTARSLRIAESLGIKSAADDARCTVCHAPLADVPAGHLASTATPTEGVSCENCHNGAATWLRSHTRYDYTYADRLHAGLRDLRSAYVRAETCVKCHQVIDPALVQAGHPELIFELDGQTASEPRHWREKPDWSGPKAWLVGQAVALREISRQIETSPNPDLAAQEQALYWLLQTANVFMSGGKGPQPSHVELAAWSNQAAQAYSTMNVNPALGSNVLSALAGTSKTFTDNAVPLPERELRAERLVLGLDRLFKSLHPKPNAPGQPELAALFDAVQDRGQFDPASFSKLLQKFADAITPKK